MTALRHIGFDGVRPFISSVPDTMLPGTDNLTLVLLFHDLAPFAKLVVGAESPERARKIYAEGSDYVILSRSIVARDLLSIRPDLRDDARCEEVRADNISGLQDVEEIIN
jgi:hypothetical protein